MESITHFFYHFLGLCGELSHPTLLTTLIVAVGGAVLYKRYTRKQKRKVIA